MHAGACSLLVKVNHEAIVCLLIVHLHRGRLLRLLRRRLLHRRSPRQAHCYPTLWLLLLLGCRCYLRLLLRLLLSILHQLLLLVRMCRRCCLRHSCCLRSAHCDRRRRPPRQREAEAGEQGGDG